MPYLHGPGHQQPQHHQHQQTAYQQSVFLPTVSRDAMSAQSPHAGHTGAGSTTSVHSDGRSPLAAASEPLSDSRLLPTPAHLPEPPPPCKNPGHRKGKLDAAERARVDFFLRAVIRGQLVVYKGELAKQLRDFVNQDRAQSFYEKLISRRKLNQSLSPLLQQRRQRRGTLDEQIEAGLLAAGIIKQAPPPDASLASPPAAAAAATAAAVAPVFHPSAAGYPQWQPQLAPAHQPTARPSQPGPLQYDPRAAPESGGPAAGMVATSHAGVASDVPSQPLQQQQQLAFQRLQLQRQQHQQQLARQQQALRLQATAGVNRSDFSDEAWLRMHSAANTYGEAGAPAADPAWHQVSLGLAPQFQAAAPRAPLQPLSAPFVVSAPPPDGGFLSPDHSLTNATIVAARPLMRGHTASVGAVAPAVTGAGAFPRSFATAGWSSRPPPSSGAAGAPLAAQARLSGTAAGASLGAAAGSGHPLNVEASSGGKQRSPAAASTG